MENRQPLISIIVPVYQAEKYLQECVESIESQTLTDREVILVDDGSRDKSGAICDRLAQMYSDISVIHKENGGAATARNAGLEAAQGVYVGFVDSDDRIAPDMYESLYEALAGTQSRIACCSWYRMFYQDGEIQFLLPENAKNISDRILTEKEAVRELLLDQGMTYSPCDKLFERTLFQDVRFPGGKLTAEDIPCIYRIISHGEKIVHIGTPKYYYRITDGSVTQKKFQPENMIAFQYMLDVKKDVEVRFPSLRQEAEFALLQSAASMYGRMTRDETGREFPAQRREMVSFFRRNLFTLLKNPFLNRNAKAAYVLIGFRLYSLLDRLLSRRSFKREEQPLGEERK